MKRNEFAACSSEHLKFLAISLLRNSNFQKILIPLERAENSEQDTGSTFLENEIFLLRIGRYSAALLWLLKGGATTRLQSVATGRNRTFFGKLLILPSAEHSLQGCLNHIWKIEFFSGINVIDLGLA